MKHFGPVTVIAEELESKLDLIRKRMRRQGPVAVLGQIGFVLLQKLLAHRSRRRIDEIIAEHA
jgi:hypothetical protein